MYNRHLKRPIQDLEKQQNATVSTECTLQKTIPSIGWLVCPVRSRKIKKPLSLPCRTDDLPLRET